MKAFLLSSIAASQGASVKEQKPLSLESELANQEEPIEQTMERLPRGVRRLAAQLRTPVEYELLWSTLTDYERLSEFIPNLALSRVISRNENQVQLRQVGSQKLLGLTFSAEVLLELVENFAGGILQFQLIKGDFRRFEGAWKLTKLPNSKGTSLLYELTVQGCVGMPVSLIEQRLKEDLMTNLLAVEKTARLKSF